MPRPKTGDKRAAILHGATEAIAEEGIGASTATIAKYAGVATGSLFRYFADKETLLNELYISLHHDVRHAIVIGFPATGPLRVRVRHIWNAYIGWGMTWPMKRKTIVQLNVSKRITAQSKEEGRVGYEQAIKTLAELGARGKLSAMPLTFVSDLLLAMAETTMTSMETIPADAGLHRDTGFEAFWRAASRKWPEAKLL